MSAQAITTVTRKIFRATLHGPWCDWVLYKDGATGVQAIVMLYGVHADRDLFEAHVALGNPGALFRDGQFQYLVDGVFAEDHLWQIMADDRSELVIVHTMHKLWDIRYDSTDPPID